MASSFDYVVVGAGIQGSCTALHLARAGKRTLLIDQGHDRGSSHGGSRIIRNAYKEAHYARLMPAAYEAWKALEVDTGKYMMVTTGLLNVSTRPPYTDLNELMSTMSSLSLPYEILEGPALRSRYPTLRLPENSKGLLDPTAGVLKADVCLKAIQDLFVSSGGEVKFGLEVKHVVPGDPVTLKTSTGDILASSVVLCLGPWASPLLATLGLSLPLEAQAIGVFYWKEKQPGSFSAPQHPSFIDLDTYGGDVFALPALEYPGLVKLCYYLGPNTDPNNANITVDESVQKLLSQYIKDFVPSLETTPSKTLPCFYTLTPDADFILDKHPVYKNIVIGAGFSGTGFKLGPIVGHILSCLATDQTPPYDISAFKIGRFLK